jgi:hypothetical protein
MDGRDRDGNRDGDRASDCRDDRDNRDRDGVYYCLSTHAIMTVIGSVSTSLFVGHLHLARGRKANAMTSM